MEVETIEKKMKLFLDDVRFPKECVSYMYKRIGDQNPIYLEKWEIVRNYNEFIKFVEKNYENITHISFDHDLADEHLAPETGKWKYKEKTGWDCAMWLREFYEENKIRLPVMYVHSMNPVGTKRIINVFK